MDSDRIYFRAASNKDYEAIHLLAIEFNVSASQICRFAMSEWLRENFKKQIELAQLTQKLGEDYAKEND
tara:strand:+ start:282 stop:488 length:207 start_codon:yes stop_codon:yes gene_type:complete